MANKSRQTANLVSGDTLFVDTANDRIGIGTSTPTARLQVGAGSTLFNEELLITSGGNTTLKINYSNTSNYSSDIRFARDGDNKWILGSSNIGSLGGFDDFVLFGGGADYYPLTAKYTSGNIGISNTNPLTRFQVGVTTETFAVTGIGSVGIGTTNPQANLTVRRVSNYTDNYTKIVDIEAFDNANPLGSNVLSIFGGAESRGGAIGFNVQNIIGNESVPQPPEPNSGIFTCFPDYGNRAMSLITWNNVSTAGKAPNGASFNIYGAHPGGTPSSNKSLNHYLMLDGNGNIGIGTTLSGAEFAVYKQNAVLSVHHAPNPVGYDQPTGVIVRTQTTSCPSLSTTYDVFRFLNKRGSLSLQGTIQGWLMVGVVSNSSGAHQSMYIYTVLSSGLGVSSANYTQAYSNTRGTNPISSIGFANDGVAGAVKLQVTTGSNATVSPCVVKVWFIGNGQSGFFDAPALM